MVVLDTNVYLDLIGTSARADRLALWLEDIEDEVSVNSVVLAEILIGVPRPDIDTDPIGALVVKSATLLTPTHDDWLAAGEALRALGGPAATRRRSFWNDLLIAASCLRSGATLVTRNARDFRRIQTVIPVATVPALE